MRDPKRAGNHVLNLKHRLRVATPLALYRQANVVQRPPGQTLSQLRASFRGHRSQRANAEYAWRTNLPYMGMRDGVPFPAAKAKVFASAAEIPHLYWNGAAPICCGCHAYRRFPCWRGKVCADVRATNNIAKKQTSTITTKPWEKQWETPPPTSGAPKRAQKIREHTR